ncbi:MAG: hypothetical protein SFW35_04280 [Chitinophagales bacterium]|nr:hypothetical protein [Chitinophagales bacterium]
MITEKEVPDLIASQVPSLRSRLNAIPDSVYKSIQSFTDHTKWLIEQGNRQAVKACFRTAERLLMEGDNAVRCAIQNVYIYSISRLLEVNGPDAKALRSLMGHETKREYLRQLNCCQA